MDKNSQKRNHHRIGSFYNPLKVQVKRVSKSAVIPTYAHSTDAGMDLYATAIEYEGGCRVVHTGIAVAIPKGYVGLIMPRSSISGTCQRLANCIGVIDSGYRGEITLKFDTKYRALMPKELKDRAKSFATGKLWDNIDTDTYNCWDKTEYQIGDRVGQLIIMPYPKVQFEVVDDLPESERGEGGYGSTGK